MTRLRFSDGEEFDTAGSLRVEHRPDGFYVVGEGMLQACDSREEGEALIRELTRERKRNGGS